MTRGAWIASAILLTTSTGARAEETRPIVFRSPPGTVLLLDRTGTGWSVVELDNGTCVAPSTPQVTSAPSTATTSGIRATPVSESLVMIVAGTVLLLATIVGVAVYNVRARALETELTKLALRDRRCSAAREVASYCSVLLALLELKETGEHGLHSEREKLRTACANYRSNAPKT